MESLALERPVVVTAIAGTPELVDGECGWLIPAGSVESLVKAMREAITAKAKKKFDRYGARGKTARSRPARFPDQWRAALPSLRPISWARALMLIFISAAHEIALPVAALLIFGVEALLGITKLKPGGGQRTDANDENSHPGAR